LLNGHLIVTAGAGSLTIKNFQNGDLGIFLDSDQPKPVLDPLDLKEGESQAITLSLDRTVGAQAEVYRLVVDQPGLMTLSGEGVVVLDASVGVYQITVAPGTSAATFKVNAAVEDGNRIVDSVRISVEGVLYGEDGLLASERVLQVINLNIDDSYYHETGWANECGTAGDDLLGHDDGDGRTYFYGAAGNDRIVTRGEMSRVYGQDGADDIMPTWAHDHFDGSTLEEIAAWAEEHGLASGDGLGEGEPGAAGRRSL
jgi:hypothetical protein